MIRRWFVLLITVATTVGILAAADSNSTLPPSAEAVREEISRVVHQQLDAFNAGDWAKAYTFAAAGIREKFALADFTTMVQANYPRLLRGRVATDLAVTDDGVRAILELRVVTAAGALAHFRYFLQRESDTWRIVGVIPFEPPTTKA